MNKEQIQQKFEDTLKELGWIFYDSEVCANNYIEKKDLLELLETGFNLGLEVAADNAEADVTILTEDGQYEMSSIQLGYDYEACVIKNSILQFKL